MPPLPDYWLTRPEFQLDRQTEEAFDRLLDAALASGTDASIPYDLPLPKWQFLCYAAERHRLALHGSGNGSIEIFEPRQPTDLNEFGAQNAVYAAADGIWPMYYAILDRGRYRMSLNNACIRLVDGEGMQSQPYYFFSISREALAQQPWRTGYVYLLPSDTFITQPPMRFDHYEVYVPQLASLAPVVPLGRLTIEPHDFPFLGHIRGHDDARLEEYANALMTGGPLPEP